MNLGRQLARPAPLHERGGLGVHFLADIASTSPHPNHVRNANDALRAEGAKEKKSSGID